MKNILILAAILLFATTNSFAEGISVDSNGNLVTGTPNANGTLEVAGTPERDGIYSITSGTGAAGVFGENTTSGNHGILGDDNFGVYGNSSSGYAGYFQGNTKVTGDLTVDGTINANITATNADTLDGLHSTGFSLSTHDHNLIYINEEQTDSVTSSMIRDGTILQSDLSFALGDGHSLDSADGTQTDIVYVNNTGNVGIGTLIPAGKLDVNGDICLGGVCLTTWPTGSGTGAFTDSGSSAYYNGGSVGIGTSTPLGLEGTDSTVLHIVKSAGTGDTTVGLRLGITNSIDAGIMSGYNADGTAGLFVGTLTNHRVGLGTNGVEYITIAQNGDLSTKGNIGVGTASPLQQLHVQGNAYVSGAIGIGVDTPTNDLQVSGSNALLSSSTGDFKLVLSKSTTADNAALLFQDNFTGFAEIGLGGNNSLHFKVSADGTTFSDAMMIDNENGRIGMGIWPESRLHVMADNDDVSVLAESTGSSYALMAWKKSDGDAVNIFKQIGTGNALSMYQGGTGPVMTITSSSGALLVLDNSGDMGINTSSPTASLDIQGATGYNQLRMRTSYTPTGTADMNGNTGDISWDDDFMYIKTSTGWKRSALSTF